MSVTRTTELPAGWRMARVGDILKIRNGYAFKSTDYQESGAPLIRQSELRSEVVDTSEAKRVDPRFLTELAGFTIREGDLLIGMSGSLGKIAEYQEKEPALQNQRTGLLLLKSGYDAKFAKLVLNFVEPQIVAEGKGVAVQNVSAKEIEDCTFALPSPDEQRRIVAEIEKQFTRLEAGVAALRRVQVNLKRYRAAVLKAACEGRLVPTKTTWPQKQIATAIQTMVQGWSPKCESEPSDDDATWAVIKTTAIQNLRFVEVENKKLPASLKPRAHLELQSGDLLVTRAGPRNRVGVACLVKSTRPRLMLCDKAYRLRCKPAVAAPAFLELVLNAPQIVDEVNKLKTGISDSGVNLTQKRFGELLVPLPPLAEQTRIVAEVERRLSVVEELESVVTANLQRATRLRQSILQKAFTGELT